MHTSNIGRQALVAMTFVLLFGLSACSTQRTGESSQETEVLRAENSEHRSEAGERRGEAGEHRSEEGEGEHGGEEGEGEHGGDGHDEEGEEDGTRYALDQTYDQVRRGTRLILNYDAASKAFVGTVENTTARVLRRVRVEVPLSNGIELGPTQAADLRPGEKRSVELTTTSTGFDGFSAHAEVGSGEHGGEGEDSEHGG